MLKNPIDLGKLHQFTDLTSSGQVRAGTEPARRAPRAEPPRRCSASGKIPPTTYGDQQKMLGLI